MTHELPSEIAPDQKVIEANGEFERLWKEEGWQSAMDYLQLTVSDPYIRLMIRLNAQVKVAGAVRRATEETLAAAQAMRNDTNPNA